LRIALSADSGSLGLPLKLEMILERASVLSSGTAFSLGVVLPNNETISLSAGKHAKNLLKPNPAHAVLPSDAFAMGSTAKMYTAAAVLRLVDAGKFALDDKALPLFDNFWMKLNGTSLLTILGPKLANVTVRHLLQMQSGIPDFDNVPSRQYQFDNPHEDLGPVQELGFLEAGRDFDCDPGTCGVYSSSNYEVLGLILAQNAGVDSWDEYTQAHDLPKDLLASMPRTKFALHGPCKNYTRVHAYSSLRHPSVDVYNVSCTGGWTCGNLISNAVDAALFVNALLGRGERVVTAASQKEMLVTSPLTQGWSAGLRYGLGLMDLSGVVREIPGSLVGHGGDTYGFNAFTAYSLEHDFSLSLAVNDENLKVTSLLVNEVYHAVVESLGKKSTIMI